MKLMDKCKRAFLEDKIDAHVTPARAARMGAVNPRPIVDGDINGEMQSEKQLKAWVKSTLATAPWLALAIILFAVFAQGAIAASALGYGLLKVAIAVVGTVIADETMFRGQPDPQDSRWLPMIRRSMIFMGICWLMAVT